MDKIHLNKLTVGCCTELDREELKRVAAAGDTRRVAKGDELVREGDTGDELLVLLEGAAEVWATVAGESQCVAKVGTGAILGEVGLLQDLPRTATVRATEDTLCFSLKRKRFLQLLDDRETGAHKMLLAIAQTLAERLAETRRTLREAVEVKQPEAELDAFRQTLERDWDL